MHKEGRPRVFAAAPYHRRQLSSRRLASARALCALSVLAAHLSQALAGLGSLLAFDEFFVHPYHQEENSVGPHQAVCLTYLLEEKLEDDIDEESEDNSVKHGIRVFFQTCKKTGVGVYESMKVLPLSPLTSKAGSVETLFLGSSNNEGGAKVRVVAGQYESVSTPVQENFVLLDIVMRPGAAAKIPVNSSHALIIYILEGVGIIKRDASVRPFYENEGHGIWFPPVLEKKLEGNYLHVTCHLWSSLRLLVLEIAVN